MFTTATALTSPHPEGTGSAEIEVKVSLWPDPKTELVAHRMVKRVRFEP